jgi:hypothetical protein
VTPETPPKVDTTTATGSRVPKVLPTGGAAFAGGSAATTGNDDGDELEVILGHPGLQDLGHVSLLEVMGMVHFMLRQA